jgi:anti-sigma-K factor RskA
MIDHPDHSTGELAPQDPFAELAAGWALHALEPEDEALFSAHLADCESCQKSVLLYADTLGDLARLAPSVAPPPELRDRILRAAAEDPRGTAEDPRGTLVEAISGETTGGFGGGQVLPLSSKGRFQRGGTSPATSGSLTALGSSVRPGGRAAWWIAAAAAVVAIVLGGGNLVLRQDVENARQTAASSQELVRKLIQPGSRMAALSTSEGDPVAYVLSRNGKLEVVTSGMPENEPGRKSFWLWGIWAQQDGVPRPLGRFDVSTEGFDLHGLGSLPPGMDTVTDFAVSEEAGTARPAQPSKVMATGSAEH